MVDGQALTERIEAWMTALCVDIGDRHLGGPGNRQATDFFARTLTSLGLESQTTEFDCIDWEGGDVVLNVGGTEYPARVSPYSLPCDVQAQLVAASRPDELEGKEFAGTVVLLHGELCKEQLMPKGFPFYFPEHHARIITALEKAKPAAIIAATRTRPALYAGVYHFPLFEDGNFDIPSVYVTDEDGRRLLRHAGSEASLRVESRRIPASGCNVLARIPGSSDERIVVCAHIDTLRGTPGALDNASGVAVLLGLAGLLAEQRGRLTMELVALNGHEHYSNAGQVTYLTANKDRLHEIAVAINIDGVGCRGAKTALSFYNVAEPAKSAADELIVANDLFVERAPWPGDHFIFVQNGRPAVGVTADIAWEAQEYSHTPEDTIEQIDFSVLADVARFLCEYTLRFAGA